MDVGGYDNPRLFYPESPNKYKNNPYAPSDIGTLTRNWTQVVSYHGTEQAPVYSVDTIFLWIAIGISLISALAILILYLPPASSLQIDGSEARYFSLQDDSEGEEGKD